MAETLVENQICEACKADVRPGALFCYSCGAAVPETTAASAQETQNEEKNIADAQFQTNVAAVKNGGEPQPKVQTKVKEAAETPFIQEKVQTDAKLKSAAAMRRKSKVYQPKKVEIIWEEHDNAPNGWFIAVAIVLTLLVGAFLYLAIYLK